MRIGVGLPFKDQRGLPLDAAGLGLRARWIEEAGLDAAWTGDASFSRLATWPDPMMWLLTVGAATAQAAERLAWLESLGFDDVMLNLRDPGASGPFESDITVEQLQQVRSLLPADPRPAATSHSPGGAA